MVFTRKDGDFHGRTVSLPEGKVSCFGYNLDNVVLKICQVYAVSPSMVGSKDLPIGSGSKKTPLDIQSHRWPEVRCLDQKSQKNLQFRRPEIMSRDHMDVSKNRGKTPKMDGL